MPVEVIRHILPRPNLPPPQALRPVGNALPAEGLHRLLRDGAAPADLPDWRVGAGWRPIETKEEREEAWFQPQSPVEVGEAYARPGVGRARGSGVS